ncbi:MAG: GNAT family N-acetyltransferase [Ignavibacteria bacterium]
MITISEINKNNHHYLNKCDEEFEISTEYKIEFTEDSFKLREIAVNPYSKRYDNIKIDSTELITGSDTVIYFGFYKDELAGQVFLKRYWNNFAWLEISIKQKFRRKGVGKELIRASVNWSKEKKLHGIMIETQNNNVAACKFYESCGFTLGGFDLNLYKGIEKHKNEVALFWYLNF